MTKVIALALLKAGRYLHSAIPFCQMRTARLVWKAISRQGVQVSYKLFTYRFYIHASRSVYHTYLYIVRKPCVEDLHWLRPHLFHGMTACDVGANIGYLTLWFSNKVGPTGRVYSFEPDPNNFQELVRNIRNNRISHCYPICSAVGSHDGAVPFSYGVNGGVGNLDNESNCNVTSLDSFVKRHGITGLNLIKIDVEGYESEVLRGMTTILGNVKKPILYIEVHPLGFRGVGNPHEVCSLVEQYYSKCKVYYSLREGKRRHLSLYQKVLFKLKPETALKSCETTLGEVRSHPGYRYHLLCLP